MVGSQPVLEETGHLGAGTGIRNHSARFALENIGFFEFARGSQIGKCLVRQAIPQGESQMSRDGMVIGLPFEFRVEESGRFQNGKHGSASTNVGVGRTCVIPVYVERLNLGSDRSAESPGRKQPTECLEFLGAIGVCGFRFGEFIDLVHDGGCGFKRAVGCRLIPCF